MQYYLEEINKILKGIFIKGSAPDQVDYLLLDSRKLIFPETSLFIPLVSERRDAHQFIDDLYRRGVRNFIVSEEMEWEKFPMANSIKVKDTQNALHSLAAWHRQQFKIPVVGITGSNGKTVVKEWLFQLLEKDFNIVRSPKSYNSQIGVPLSVWSMKPVHQLAIFEAGISQPGEMINLERIIRPTIGIFTNIGDAHNEGFLNIRQKINEKLILFTKADLLIYCKDYPELNDCILQFHSQVRKKNEDENESSLKLFTWSRKTVADLRVIGIKKNSNHTRIEALYLGNQIFISIPFVDEGSIENAIHCWAFLIYLNIAERDILERMERLGNVAMRLELKEAINNCSLINDSYNSDLGSLNIALDFLQQQKQHPRKVVILSDILQSGKGEGELYEAVASLLRQKGIHQLIGIGKSISKEKNIFSQIENLESKFFISTEEFIQSFLPKDFQHETILLKGSRIFEFERISKLLEQKVHQTILEINLTSIGHNLKQYQELLAPSTKIMAMVKAFSYGSGSYEIASLLQFHGVEYLAVAYADEGVDLRRAGITLPIMVMNPEPSTYEIIMQWNLEPEIYSMNLLHQFESEAKKNNMEHIPIHLKLDTGMHRLGFEEQDLQEVGDILKNNSYLRVISIFSHLAASEDPVHDSFTRHQGKLFISMSEKLIKILGYPVLRHIANSSAIHRHPSLQMDMVRLGIGMYGIDSSPIMQGKLKNVSTLKTTIAQLKEIPAGETIGYGRSGLAKIPIRIATVRIGYADGYPRKLGNGNGKLLVRGKLAPIIGQICMDMLMIDVTGIAGLSEGEDVVVFGDGLSVKTIAEWAETIPYEILTGISQRVKRIYYQE